MLIALAAIAPSAMASSVRSPTTVGRWPVNAVVGLQCLAGRRCVAEAAPTISSTTHETKTPSPAYRPVRLLRRRRRQVAGVVGGVGVPAGGVAEGRADVIRKPPRTGAAAGGAGVGLGEDRSRRRSTKTMPRNGNGVPLEGLHQVVAEEGDRDLGDDDDQQAAATTGMLVSELSASAPLTLLTANQPMPAMTALSPAGRTLPK